MLGRNEMDYLPSTMRIHLGGIIISDNRPQRLQRSVTEECERNRSRSLLIRIYLHTALARYTADGLLLPVLGRASRDGVDIL